MVSAFGPPGGRDVGPGFLSRPGRGLVDKKIKLPAGLRVVYVGRSNPGKKNQVKPFATRRRLVHSRGLPYPVLLLPEILPDPSFDPVAVMGLAHLPGYRGPHSEKAASVRFIKQGEVRRGYSSTAFYNPTIIIALAHPVGDGKTEAGHGPLLPGIGDLHRYPFASFSPAVAQDLSAALCGHPGTEAVRAKPPRVMRLIRTFHFDFSG
jgi:hypothetical protein